MCVCVCRILVYDGLCISYSQFQPSGTPQPIELDKNVDTIGGTFVDEERSISPFTERHGECVSEPAMYNNVNSYIFPW